MKYCNELTVKDTHLYQCFKPEIHESKRSKLEVSQGSDKVLIKVNAADAVALRAEMNSVLKLLVVDEKISGVLEEQNEC